MSAALERAKGDGRRLGVQLLPLGRPQAEAGDHLVGAPAEQLQHLSGLRRVTGLADSPACADDDRVDAEHRPPRPVDRPGLAGGVLERVAVGRLLETGCDDLEREVELLEDRPALRRRRGEDERRRHPRLRAAQISSQGHFLAHSAVT